jgi:hypothetical protein
VKREDHAWWQKDERSSGEAKENGDEAHRRGVRQIWAIMGQS